MAWNGQEKRAVGDLPERMQDLDKAIDKLSSGISTAQSHANAAKVVSEKTLTIVEQYIKTTDERYKEGREDHKAMWQSIDESSAFQNTWKGFMAGITFIAAAAGAVVVMVYNYLTGHVKF